MKRIMLIITLLVAIGLGNGFAQGGNTKKENFSWQKQYMDEAGIPADIQAKIDSLKAAYDVKIKAIKKDDTLTEEVKKEKIKEQHKQKAEDIFALLTKEQKEKIKEIRERIKKENGE